MVTQQGRFLTRAVGVRGGTALGQNTESSPQGAVAGAAVRDREGMGEGSTHNLALASPAGLSPAASDIRAPDRTALHGTSS